MSQAPVNDACCGPWKCFFCGEVFPDAVTAGRHFGEHEGCEYPVPGCVDPLRRDEKARLHAVQLANYEARKACDERDAAQEDAEAYRAMPDEIERIFGKGVRTLTAAARAAEEAGYAKGVEDMKSQGYCVEPKAHAAYPGCGLGFGGFDEQMRPVHWALETNADMVRHFREYLRIMKAQEPERYEALLAPLRGRNLACYCALDAPDCHADVWLELANEQRAEAA